MAMTDSFNPVFLNAEQVSGRDNLGAEYLVFVSSCSKRKNIQTETCLCIVFENVYFYKILSFVKVNIDGFASKNIQTETT